MELISKMCNFFRCLVQLNGLLYDSLVSPGKRGKAAFNSIFVFKIEANCQPALCMSAPLWLGCTTDTGCLPAPLATNVLNKTSSGIRMGRRRRKKGKKDKKTHTAAAPLSLIHI